MPCSSPPMTIQRPTPRSTSWRWRRVTRLPTIYPWRDHVAAGGLISYTSSVFDAGRHAGIYAGRILMGAEPGRSACHQPTKFELVINLKTAKALGLDVPPTAARLADEVIE